MSKFEVPDELQRRIIRKNGMNPEEYSVILAGDDFLLLLCHKSRDTVRIDRGDRRWD